jgi:hypothetical protein
MYLVICLASCCYCGDADDAKHRSLVNACSSIYLFKLLAAAILLLLLPLQ